MKDAARLRAARQGHTATASFFIPNLCLPQVVLILVLVTQIMVLAFVLASSSLPRFPWASLAMGSLLSQWVVLVSTMLLCALRSTLSQLRLYQAVIGSLLIILLVTAGSSFIAIKWFTPLTEQSLSYWWLLKNVLVAGVMGGMVLRVFYLLQLLKLRELSELQARLDSLRARIRPHFLFNTLNSVASLIASRPQLAEQAIEDLSELFRASLKEDEQPATVADELQLCALYLSIEQLRLGERLKVEWSVEEAAMQQLMPSLLLQPLIENAVHHGVAQLDAGGTVTVAVSQQDGRLVAVVENPIPQQDNYTEGFHMALSNIEQRIWGLFGHRATLQRGVKGDSRYYVELSLPLEDAQ